MTNPMTKTAAQIFALAPIVIVMSGYFTRHLLVLGI